MMTSALISIARSAAAVSVLKYGLPVPAPKTIDAPFLEVADGAAADERLGDGAHLDRRHHARDDVLLLERVLQRERVDHRRQHAHVVGGGAIHAARAGRDAAEDVAAADDDRDLDTHRLDFGDVFRDLRRHGRVDAVGLLAHQGFAGKFQENAFVGGAGWGSHEIRLYPWRMADG